MLPVNAAWNLVDYVLGSVGTQERGGYTYASPDLSTVKATASYVVNGIVAPFAAADQHLTIDEDGEVYKVTSPTVATDIGVVSSASLSFHRERVIFPQTGGTGPPSVYDGTSLAGLGGSPPYGKYATVFNDWSILASSAALPNRIWFSGAGDPASWDTANAWIDADHKLCGIAAVSGAILGFTDHGVERWRGSIAPPGSDFTHNVLTAGAPAYTRSIIQNGSNVFWASQDGIFMTDGATPYDLSFDCGIKSYWQSLVASGASWNVSAGILDDRYLVVSIMDGATFKDCVVIDVPLRRCWRWTNIDAQSFWSSGSKLYFGSRGSARVGELSSTFLKSSTVQTDGDGTTVASVIETRYYGGPSGLKTWRALYPTYDLQDSASNAPTVQFSYVLSPEATNYTNIGSAQARTNAAIETFDSLNVLWDATAYTWDGTWLENSGERKRTRFALNKKSEGIGFKLTRANAASNFILYGLDADVYGMERSRTS